MRLVVVVLVALVVTTAVRLLVVDVALVPSASMAPALAAGDRVVVWRPGAGDVERGDVVVFDGTGSLQPWVDRGPLGSALARAGGVLGLPGAPVEHVKRVVGLPGERVACCDDQGRITVDGEPLAEPYLAPGTAPSRTPFDVELGEDRLWLLGDDRDTSRDSRALLGSPGGGAVPTERVLGRVVAVTWPPGRTALLDDRPDDGTASQDHAPGRTS